MDEVHNEPVHSRMKPSKAARVEFNDRLIAEVQKRPVLGLLQTRLQTPAQDDAWEEVAAECGHDPDGSTGRARWKSLRDTFTKKHRAWKTGAPSGSGADSSNDIRWLYYKLMIFLKDLVDIGT
ncbi:hypothetical protein HPB49_011873 [Dermacentor silvarum]|uniref:Uncharacterized protein n=1 Tax=Dermacentor silvarum TaxID=543639 RepID=A0ACB8CX90_DERSI|nr:hypothetical protein HPB49_011873 [Dermacentor silvarum]